MGEKHRIAILASGNGSNAENIVEHFSENEKFKVELIGTNKKDAFVLERAERLNVATLVFSKTEMQNGDLEKKLLDHNIDFIVLAGFLLKIPENLIAIFEDRIINIHPALLPRFGGKGMYGDNVHNAVKESKVKETGISIHLVNKEFDKGRIVFQAKTQIKPEDDISQIAAKVHELEYKYFPKVIENYILGYTLKKKRDISV